MTSTEYDHLFEATAAAVRDQLGREFGYRATYTPGEALFIEGNTPRRNAARAALMRMRRGTYPWPVRRTRLGRRPYVLIEDITLALVGSRPVPPTPTPPAAHSESGKRGPGRPRKSHVPMNTAVAAGGGST